MSGNGERDNAEIRRRPLDISISIPIIAKEVFEVTFTNPLMIPIFGTYNIQHEQIFFEDEKGGNIGFFGDNKVRSDALENIFSYKSKDNKKYDDKIMRKAVKRVAPQMGGYSLIKNNCQDFIQKVIKEYNVIKKEGND